MKHLIPPPPPIKKLDQQPLPLTNESPQIVVQIFNKNSKQVLQTLIWNSEKPIGIGSPFRWSLEKIKKNSLIRIRNLRTPFNIPQSNGACEFPISKLTSISSQNTNLNHSVDLPGSHTFSITFKPIQTLQPAYISCASTQYSLNQKENKELTLFMCVGTHILKKIHINKEKSIYLKNQKIFNIKHFNNEIQIFSHHDDLKINNQKSTSSSKIFTFNSNQLKNSIQIKYTSITWQLTILDKPSLDFLKKFDPQATIDPEAQRFNKITKKTFSILSFLFLFSFASQLFIQYQTPEKTEETPPQYTRIVLKPNKTQPTETHAARKASKGASPNQAQKTTLTKAFQSRTFQNSLSKLMQGGITKLMKQSQLMVKNTGNSKSYFQGKNAPNINETISFAGSDTKVASIGGLGLGGNGEKNGVGYGNSQEAGIPGQGNGSIDLATWDSFVQNGLTKDEVGKVIHEHMSEIRYCYETSLLRNPHIQGKLTVDFTISPKGLVSQADAKESSLEDARLDDCILRRLKTWPFPLPKGGVYVSVNYPFVFKSIGR